MIYTTQPNYVLLSIDEIRPNRLQPEYRTEDNILKNLAEVFDNSDVFIPPVVVHDPDPRDPDRPYELIDGHRRYELARNDGATSIFCYVTTGDPGLLFVQLNAGNLEFNDTTWWAIWSQATTKQRITLPIPKKVIRDLAQLKEWLGSNAAVAKWGKGTAVSPHFVTSPVRMILAAGLIHDNGRSHTRVSPTPDETRLLALQVLESSRQPRGLKNRVRTQIVAHGLAAAQRAGFSKTSPAPDTTWEGCGATIYRRELDKILSGEVLDGTESVSFDK